MDNMFAGWSQISGSMSLPLFETRKALIIINLQNDSLYVKDDLYITKNRDFVPRLKEMIPYFRKHGDVVWVKTHMGVLPSMPMLDAAQVEEESTKQADKNREAQNEKEQQMKNEVQAEQAREEAARRDKLTPIDPNAGPGNDYPMYHPSSKTQEMMRQASAETRAEKRSADLQVFDDKQDPFEKHLSRPRKGQQARFYIADTKGAEICDDLLEVMDESLDLMLTKHHYSAFDQTSLLTALRAKLVTEVYLCGCLTNVGVYSTAADAVQHGLQVTVVEDCLGYRSEEKHEEAMRQMADIMGVHGIDSEEIIEESGGRPIPDARTPGITLDELSINSPQIKTQSLSHLAGVNTGNFTKEPPMDHIKQTLPSPQPISQDSSSSLAKAHVLDARADLEENTTPIPNPTMTAKRKRNSWNVSRSRILGPSDSIGSGDSRIIYNVIQPPSMSSAFIKVKDEVGWQTMFHRSGQVPRLVAVQGEIGPDGRIPIYRHPADESPPLLPFTPAVLLIKEEVEKILMQSFNHALIQLYRDGVDNISEHSDKTLDIVRNSVIVNVSLGAQRTMTLRTKKSKQSNGTEGPHMRLSQRVKLPNNSVFVMGSQTNREWLHGLKPDKRPVQEKTEAEKAFGGERISITFRQIGTFIDNSGKVIWGAGAKGKTMREASEISRDDAQMEAMICAFGKENHEADFDWETEYGSGYDVVNLITKQAKLQLCTDLIANHRVQLALCEKSIPFTATEREALERPKPEEFVTRFHPWMHGLSNSDNPVFHDVNDDATAVEGDMAILFYLEKHHPFPTSREAPESGRPSAPMYTLVAQSNELLFRWRELRDSENDGRESPLTNRFRLEGQKTPVTSLHDEIHALLRGWEVHIEGLEHIAGSSWSIIDCAFWPVLNHLTSVFQELNERSYPHLWAYHKRVLARGCVKMILDRGK